MAIYCLYVPFSMSAITSLRCMSLSFPFNPFTVKSGFQISLRKLNRSSVGLCSVYTSNWFLSSGGTSRTYAKCFQHFITLLSRSKYFESFSKNRLLSITTSEISWSVTKKRKINGHHLFLSNDQCYTFLLVFSCSYWLKSYSQCLILR